MSPKKEGKIPKHSRVFSVKSLAFLSQIPRPIFVESPVNPFLISCISHRRSVPRAPISPLPQIPSTVPASCVASSTLRPSSVVFRGVPLGFASFSSAFNRFGAPLFSAKDTKASASVGITATPSSAPVKSKKRKASSAPSRPIQSSRERKYSTRSSSRLVSKFSNTDDDPVDLVSSPPGLGADDDSSGDEDAGNPQGSPTTEELIDDYSLEERKTGLVPESDPPCIPSDLSSRRARFQQLERSAINVDFGFSDAGTSTSSQLIRSVPSAESLSFAKAVRNFLELGLHQLGETQRLAMISVVSILRVAPEFSSDSSLLENVATIFLDSDAAQARSTSLMAKVEDFHYKRRKAEGMEQENSSVRAQIQNLTTEYDTNEDEVKRLEEKILEHRAKMASLMDEAESLEKKLLSSRRDTQIIVDEVVSLKEEYGEWAREIQESDEKQGECLLKWEQLRRLFC
ncbi:hypothetical protein F511_13733 [Dorcoceras hygrometricum]|uniref:Uncharacterized protein n=1 Tax=Dorcoceras hygrometricum TaxID=472368 RepID=A0A2Z7B4Q6_9LAMI|nr:hypothetical protein F511_13733 [Dorcoceras hygrometricum]